MGALDDLGTFKKNESGKTVFYPWGWFGKSYILTDGKIEHRIRRFVCLYCITTCLVFIAAYVIVDWKALVVVLASSIWYKLRVRALVVGCPVADDRLKLRERFTNHAKKSKKSVLWLMLIVSILYVGFGLLLLAQSTSHTVWIAGAFLVSLFAVFAVGFGYMIKIGRS